MLDTRRRESEEVRPCHGSLSLSLFSHSLSLNPRGCARNRSGPSSSRSSVLLQAKRERKSARPLYTLLHPANENPPTDRFLVIYIHTLFSSFVPALRWLTVPAWRTIEYWGCGGGLRVYWNGKPGVGSKTGGNAVHSLGHLVNRLSRWTLQHTQAIAHRSKPYLDISFPCKRHNSIQLFSILCCVIPSVYNSTTRLLWARAVSFFVCVGYQVYIVSGAGPLTRNSNVEVGSGWGKI